MENNQNNQLSNKEQYDEKRQEKLKEQNRTAQKRDLKRRIKIAAIILAIGGVFGGFIWYLATRPPIPEEEIISRNDLHWHPELAIFVKGEKVEIPANLGLGAVHNPIHTHDSSGIIHLEFQGIVRKDNLKLSRFFKMWGKDLMEFGSSVRMTVNGEENTELENYIMQDKDKIELRYE